MLTITIALLIFTLGMVDDAVAKGPGSKQWTRNIAADPDNTGTTDYSVFARALGKPGGKTIRTICATDTDSEDECCSTEF